MKHLITLAKDLARSWRKDNVPQLAAAFAYYAIFLIPPFLAIVLAVLGMLFGSAVSREDLYQTLFYLAGNAAALDLIALLRAYSLPQITIPTLIIASAALIIAGSQTYIDLRDSFNLIWGVASKERWGLGKILRERTASLIVTAAAGLIFMILISASTVVLVFSHSLSRSSGESLWLIQFINVGATFLLMTFLLTLIYSTVSSVVIRWRDALPGAATAAFLLMAGNYLLSLYFAVSPSASIYGVFGIFVLILIWAYYVAALFFAGFEITKHYVLRHDRPLETHRHYYFTDWPDRLKKSWKKII